MSYSATLFSHERVGFYVLLPELLFFLNKDFFFRKNFAELLHELDCRKQGRSDKNKDITQVEDHFFSFFHWMQNSHHISAFEPVIKVARSAYQHQGSAVFSAHVLLSITYAHAGYADSMQTGTISTSFGYSFMNPKEKPDCGFCGV